MGAVMRAKRPSPYLLKAAVADWFALPTRCFRSPDSLVHRRDDVRIATTTLYWLMTEAFGYAPKDAKINIGRDDIHLIRHNLRDRKMPVINAKCTKHVRSVLGYAHKRNVCKSTSERD
ncbi:hypothetical protein KS4_23750 [Poriferisphaera corsica]|uniref:Uncharacterized protein n=1 Tax=Poriferisphaera corsica TaxID=2528020 RepID=A0A517YVP3_9BACT|nr:hypothetical protein KS4_23750 [Poriferisphaera corsica]